MGKKREVRFTFGERECDKQLGDMMRQAKGEELDLDALRFAAQQGIGGLHDEGARCVGTLIAMIDALRARIAELEAFEANHCGGLRGAAPTAVPINLIEPPEDDEDS